MTHHDDHHNHGADCTCHECSGDKEKTSIEEAGGVAVGFSGHIHGFNADAEARLDKSLLSIGRWVEKEAGSLLGHIKAAVYLENGEGVTLNLTDISTGVEHHGKLGPREKVGFNIMAAVLDVDAHSLGHVIEDALGDSGLDCCLDEPHHHHGHKHEEGHTHGHSGHGHDHDDCCGHEHSHGHEHGGSHTHGHSDHGHEPEVDECHCQACEDRRGGGSERSEKKSFWDKVRRKKK
jgi:hypothetical protein